MSRTSKPYSLELELNDQVYTSKGETLLDAVEDVVTQIPFIKTKGVFVVRHKKQEADHLMPLHRVRRLLVNRMYRVVWSKQMEVALGTYGKVPGHL